MPEGRADARAGTRAPGSDEQEAGGGVAQVKVPRWLSVERFLAALGLVLLVAGIFAYRGNLDGPGHPSEGPDISVAGTCEYGEGEEGRKGVTVPYVVEGTNDGEVVLWLGASFMSSLDDDPIEGSGAVTTPGGEYSMEGELFIPASERLWETRDEDSCEVEYRLWEKRPGGE